MAHQTAGAMGLVQLLKRSTSGGELGDSRAGLDTLAQAEAQAHMHSLWHSLTYSRHNLSRSRSRTHTDTGAGTPLAASTRQNCGRMGQGQ